MPNHASLVAIALTLTAGAAAQRPAHTRVLVNDARSHGKVGDALLSLDEALRLNGGTLTRSELSAAELAQIHGTSDVSDIVLDANALPATGIVAERDLTPIAKVAHGTAITRRRGR